MYYTKSQRYHINSKSPYFQQVVTRQAGRVETFYPLNEFDTKSDSFFAMAAVFRSVWVIEEQDRIVWDNGYMSHTAPRVVYFKTKEDAETYLKRMPELFDMYRWLNDRFYVRICDNYKAYTKFSEPYQALVRVQTKAR